LPDVVSPTRWSLMTRLAFRWCVIYFGLYVLITQMLGTMFVLPVGNIPELGQLPPIRQVTEWVASRVFGVTSMVVNSTGSGDRVFDWVQAFCLFVIASVATIVWSWLDRGRERYVGLYAWFRLFLRFALGTTMLSYGLVKAVPLQMPAPSLTRLLEPYGNFSPMGVLWASIGAARGYEMFSGLCEVLAGILLLVPGLTTLGSLVCLAAAMHVFVLNMTYDVPVKLFSFHLILMALVLLGPDAKRLASVLVLNRPAESFSEPRPFQRRRAMQLIVAAQLVFGAYVIGIDLYGAAKSWTRFGGGAPKSVLYGIWNVEAMSIDGHTRSPLVIDFDRWRRVIFQFPTAAAFQRMDETFTFYSANIDPNAKVLTLSKRDDKSWSAHFAFQQPASDRLILDGAMNQHAIRMELRRVDHTTFLLVSRGFHWIQEYPFNR